MIEEIKNFKVNWIDGMKISKEHFLSLQDFADARVKDAIGIGMSRYGYGLLSSHLSKNDEYSVNIDAHKSLKISIKKLRAITPSGYRIEITQQTPPIKEEIIVEEFANKEFEDGYVILNINQEESIPFGEQDPKEIPPRYPNLNPAYSFSYANADNLEKSGLGPHQLPIAKIIKDGNSFTTDSNYIPPSCSLGAHRSLIDFYNTTESFIKIAEKSAIFITQKIKTKQSDNPIADTMHIVVDKVFPYLAQQITYVKWEEYNIAPTKLLEIIVSFARIFKGAVDVSTPQDKEQLFNYFGEWTDLKGGDYEKILTDIINMQYNHLDVSQNISLVSGFMNTIEKLFTVLTQVDYIGKRRDMGIFVNEKIVSEKNEKTGGTSFLAE